MADWKHYISQERKNLFFVVSCVDIYIFLLTKIKQQHKTVDTFLAKHWYIMTCYLHSVLVRGGYLLLLFFLFFSNFNRNKRNKITNYLANKHTHMFSRQLRIIIGVLLHLKPKQSNRLIYILHKNTIFMKRWTFRKRNKPKNETLITKKHEWIVTKGRKTRHVDAVWSFLACKVIYILFT